MEFDKLRREMRDLIVDVAEPRFDADALRAQIAASIASLRPRHPIPLAPVSVSLSFLLAAALGWNLFRAPQPSADAAPLQSGETRLLLHGAQISLEANAEVCEGIPVSLQSGAAVVEVPPNAGPFLLETPAGTILCRGGKFRVGVSPQGDSSSVLVLEGEVGIDEASGSRKLAAGEAAFFKRRNP